MKHKDSRHFADDILKPILLIENWCLSIKISMTCIPKVPLDSEPALVQIMAWRRSGAMPLSEPETVMTPFADAYMRHSASMSQLVHNNVL